MLLSIVCTVAQGAELPSFRKGLWQFERTMAGQGAGGKSGTISSKSCADPTADMKRMNDRLAKQGCVFSPTTVKGNVYAFSAECRLQGMVMKTRSVITVESDSAYTVQVTGEAAGQPTNELLKARRVGDC